MCLTDKSRRGSRQSISPCGYKTLPNTLCNMSSCGMPINIAALLLAWSPSHPPAGTVLRAFCYWFGLFIHCSAFYSNSFHAIHVDDTEELFKASEDIHLTLCFHIPQQQCWMFSVRLGGGHANTELACQVAQSYIFHQQLKKHSRDAHISSEMFTGHSWHREVLRSGSSLLFSKRRLTYGRIKAFGPSEQN